jgi:hypothetical protein
MRESRARLLPSMANDHERPAAHDRAPRSAQRIAAGYALGAAFVLLLVALWIRGAGRLIVPLLLAGLAWLGVARVRRWWRESS